MRQFPCVMVLAAGALAGPLQAQGEASRDDAGIRRFALSDRDTVAFRSSGAGPTVVIVPGLLGADFGFRHVTLRLLAEGMRVVVVDPLGTGDSSRPRAADYTLEAQAARIGTVLAAAAVEPAILVCHSVSASICYRMALLHPERVRGIVSINGGPDEDAASPGLKRAMRFAPVLRIVGGAGRARSRLRDGLVENSADPAWVTAEVLAAYGRPYTDFGSALNAFSGMAAAREPLTLGPRLHAIRVPVRLLVGDSGAGGRTTAEQIEVLEQIPDFQAWSVANSGQYIHEEQPQAVVNAVLTLQRTTPSAQARR